MFPKMSASPWEEERGEVKGGQVEGDPYVAVVQSAHLTRHVGGAVHMLVFAFMHGVRTSLVFRV